MKTAISIPDEVFGQVSQRTAALGVSRSEFFTTAAVHYLRELDEADLTDQIDAALEVIGVDDSGPAAAAANRARLTAQAEDW